MTHITSLVLLFALVGSNAAAQQGWRSLWNGKDFSDWDTWLGTPYTDVKISGVPKNPDGKYVAPVGKNRDPLKVFSVVTLDGRPAIRISGEISGTLATKDSLGDYHLRVQFKWGEKKWPPRLDAKRDSAVFFHGYDLGQAGNGQWPRCLEFQVTETDVGDLSTVETKAIVRARPQGEDPAIYDPAGEVVTLMRRTPHKGKYNHTTKSANHEKPHGQWNTLELYCVKDEAILVVNGGMVNRATSIQRLDGTNWVPLAKGIISLQSKNAEIFYRDVEIRSIKAMPAEFAGR